MTHLLAKQMQAMDDEELRDLGSSLHNNLGSERRDGVFDATATARLLIYRRAIRAGMYAEAMA